MKKIKIKLENSLNYKEIFKYLSDSLQLGLKQYIVISDICLREPIEEAIHDFRVSIRRLIAQTDLAYRIYPSNYIIQIRDEIKKQLKFFSPLRDIQVQIITINKLRKQFPELNHFYYELLAEEHEMITNQKIKIKEFDTKDFDGLLFFYLLDLKKYMMENKTDEKNIIELINQKFTKVLEAKDSLDTQNLDTFHKFRIAFKKFRYSLESAMDLLKIDKKIQKQLSKYQSWLGEIQDLHVLSIHFEQFVLKRQDIESTGFETAKKYFSEQIMEKLENFTQNIDIIYQFWNMEEQINDRPSKRK